MNAGNKVLSTDFNDLFARLETVRSEHSVSGSFNTNITPKGTLTQASQVQTLKNNLTTLANSEWLDSTFASKISVPSIGALMQALQFNAYETVVEEVEAICPNYSQYGQYSQYSQASAYFQFSQT